MGCVDDSIKNALRLDNKAFISSDIPNFKRFVTFNVTMEYPNMYKIILFKDKKTFYRSSLPSGRRERPSDVPPSYSSLARTRRIISDLVLCNDFEFFCTFTFDPDKVDRFNYSACLHKISVWIHRQKVNNPDFSYIFIPEQHKDGAWHFHALFSHYSGSMRDSNHFTAYGEPIYNITSYRSGFTTAIRVQNKNMALSYILKYVTKSLCSHFNKRRFITSHCLIRPIKKVNSDVFQQTLPLFRKKIADYPDSELYFIYK